MVFFFRMGGGELLMEVRKCGTEWARLGFGWRVKDSRGRKAQGLGCIPGILGLDRGAGVDTFER